MIAITGDISAFRAQLAQEMARLDREISQTYAEWTYRIFAEIVQGTAQWSANLVSNFRYSVGEPDYSYTQLPNKTGSDSKLDHWRNDQGVFYAGQPYGIDVAMLRMMGVKPPTWRDNVFITNATPDEEGGYLEDDIASGMVKLRPINLVNGAAVTIYTVAQAEAMRTMP